MAALDVGGQGAGQGGAPKVLKYLEVAFARHPDRWKGPTKAAAIAIRDADHLTPDQWVPLLDEIQVALAGVLPE